jgi:hypothetical protein
MNKKKFDEFLQNRLEKTQKMLGSKGVEYANEKDVFKNFKDAARILNTSPNQALIGMYIKHHVSLMEFVRGEKYPDEEIISEKIGDMINYLILLEAMFHQQTEEDKLILGYNFEDDKNYFTYPDNDIDYDDELP